MAWTSLSKMKLKIREKLDKYIRILKIARKPDKSEFLDTTKVCIIGSLIIGIIGFIFYLISIWIG